MRPLGEAGLLLLVVAFAFVCGLTAWLAVKARAVLPASGQRETLLVLLALLFLLVRVVYFLLLGYGDPKFNHASGDVCILAGMGLLMKIFIVIILLAAHAMTETIDGVAGNKRVAASCDVDRTVN
ncbi:hypothetical protein BDV29DRAFT_157632 [Aspergillus leporis]|uniref:DUF7702 domain-containing protein n=1 Tax=Aspergillus leporis TaxID=41062 RepID=A0A5N5X289_9EURO|nr:hypothetical protein BDV29DRAFT_157632 [Aspergillus leporis]